VACWNVKRLTLNVKHFIGIQNLVSIEMCADKVGDFARLYVPVGLELRIQQLTVERKLEAPAIRRHQGERLDLRLEFLEQFGCQTDSPASVVSNGTIFEGQFQHLSASIQVIKKHPRR